MNLGANTVVCERVLNLAGDVAIDITKPEKKQDQQDERKRGAAHNHGRQVSVATSEVTPTLCYGRLLFCTHNLTAATRLGDSEF